MKTLLTLLLATLCAATGYSQTMKALAYNTTNGVIIYTNTNNLRFSNNVVVESIETHRLDIRSGTNLYILLDDGIADFNVAASFNHPDGIQFTTNTAAAATRTNLGAQATLISGTNIKTINGQPILGAGNLVISGGTNTNSFNQSLNTTDDVNFNALNVSNKAATRTNLGLGATWLTNTNVTNFRTAIGLGATNNVSIGDDGGSLTTDDINAGNVNVSSAVTFTTNTAAAATRTNLALGATNIVTFAGLTNNGDITINSTTASNGLLFIRRTNNEAFLGLANLIASNNTTISNETLFRVGTAEATNRSAQFGFRSTNTNGSGVAVFSVFGYNALMQIGVDALTNAVIYSGGGTNNQVMTLIKSGATEFARPISFANTTNAATTRTNLGAAKAPIWAYKSTNQTNSTTNLVSDAALTFTATANTKYAVTLFIQMDFGADAAKGKMFVSNAPTVIGHWTVYEPINSQVTPTGIPITNEALFFAADAQEPASFVQNFVVAAGTNNAPITFQFARFGTNTNVVIVGAGSYLKAEVIE